MKKKLLSVLLVGVLIVGFTGCGNSKTKKASDVSNNNKKSINNVVNCIGLQKSENGEITGRKAIFENDKIVKIIDYSNANNNKDAGEYCKLFNKIESKYNSVSIKLEDNNCSVTYDIASMSDSDLEGLALRNRKNNQLYNKINYNDYFEYVSSNGTQICFKDDIIEKKYASNIDGEYNGLIYGSIGETYDWYKARVKFENGKYICSYSINNNNYEVVGNYSYDLSTGILKLTMDENNSKVNSKFTNSCDGIKRVYEKIEGYDLEIVDYISNLNTDYQKSIKLNNK